MSERNREIAGWPFGFDPDAPSKAELLAESRATLARLDAGTEVLPPWITPEQARKEAEQEIASLASTDENR